MSSVGSVGRVRRGSSPVPGMVIVVPLLLIATACGSGVENANSAVSDSAALSTSSKPPTQYSFESFDVPGATRTIVSSINDVGVTVGHYIDGSGHHGFIRSRSGAITTVDFDGADFTNVEGINNLGVAVGYFQMPGPHQHGFERSPTGSIKIIDYVPFPGLAETYAAAINNRGDVVGGYGPTYDVGFVLSRGRFTSQPNPPNSSTPPLTYPYGINDLGMTSGFYVDPAGVEHGYVLSGATYTIVDLGSSGTEVYELNNRGQVIVDADTGCGFIFDINKKRFDPLPCFGVGSFALGINNRGQFTGFAFDPDPTSNALHGLIATPVRSDD